MYLLCLRYPSGLETAARHTSPVQSLPAPVQASLELAILASPVKLPPCIPAFLHSLCETHPIIPSIAAVTCTCTYPCTVASANVHRVTPRRRILPAAPPALCWQRAPHRTLRSPLPPSRPALGHVRSARRTLQHSILYSTTLASHNTGTRPLTSAFQPTPHSTSPSAPDLTALSTRNVESNPPTLVSLPPYILYNPKPTLRTVLQYLSDFSNVRTEKG